MSKLHKSILAAALGAVLTVGVAGFAGAQVAGAKGQNGLGQKGEHAMKMRGHGMRFGDKLGLTDAQKKQMKDVMTQARERRKAIWANDNQTVGALKNQLKALHEETKSKMDAVLTPAQREKLANRHKGTKGGGKVVPPTGA
ncbi:MAG: hypothetical protein JST30_11120 [Armatimonadetes bacterium]|nr:hypothetical protein [Armatimonadota bacterium]